MFAKLLARWRGNDGGKKGGRSATVAAPVVPKGPPKWEADRFALMERLWGEGMSIPGGPAGVVEMVMPCALNPAFSVLDLGAGLGGGTRAVAKQYGVWITGMEHDAAMAREAMRRSNEAEMARNAPILPFEDGALALKQRAYHVIYARDAFFAIQAKEQLLDQVEQALKPGGQFMFTDYVLAAKEGDAPAVAAWQKAEGGLPQPWPLERWKEELVARKLRVRVTEDGSEAHQKQILAAWQVFVQGLEPGGIAPATQALLMRETEIWVRRVAALDSGALRHYRIYATKPAEVLK